MNANHTMPPEIDYTPAINVAKNADIAFTMAHGITNFRLWDKAIENAVEEYNTKNGTNFDPVEARWRYIEQQEKILYG